MFACLVYVLDGSTVSIDVNKRATGDVLLREVFKHVGLDEEKEYFGLSFQDNKGQVHWLDEFKQIRKQVKHTGSGQYSFRMRVKLYPSSPTYLFDESTKYFLTLQIKDDLLNGKLVCSDETLSQLISYMVQSEFGDFDPTEHQLDYLDSLPYLEDKSLEFKQKITQLHREKRGVLPAECDKQFLDIASRLDRYGMDFHQIIDSTGIKLQLGVSSRGLTVFCGEHPNLTPLNHFPWVRIAAVNFKNKQLVIEMVVLPNQDFVDVIHFSCPSKSTCKTLWKSCVEHHTFFRSVKDTIVRRPSTSSLFRRGSTFRYSGRTQFKLMQENTSTAGPRRGGSKRKSEFERLTSRRSLGRKTL